MCETIWEVFGSQFGMFWEDFEENMGFSQMKPPQNPKIIQKQPRKNPGIFQDCSPQRANDLHLFLFGVLKPRFALFHAICLKKFSQQFNQTNPNIVLFHTLR